MKKILVFMTLFLSFALVSSAQVVVPSKDKPTELEHGVFGLGGAFGLGTGMGLSFRHHLPSVVSYQIASGIIKDKKNLIWDIGIEMQFDLMRGESTRFYAGGGAGYYYAGENKNDLDSPGRFALGIGIESKAREALHFALCLYFTYFSDGQILPLPQLGVHYYFF